MQGLSMNNWPTYIVQEMPEKANNSLPDLIKKIKFGRVEPLTSGLIIDKEDLKDVLYYLQKLVYISEEPEFGEKPDYVPLGFHDLSDMIGVPVYVKDGVRKGHWEIVVGTVRANRDYVCFKGESDKNVITPNIFRTKEGAEDDRDC